MGRYGGLGARLVVGIVSGVAGNSFVEGMRVRQC